MSHCGSPSHYSLLRDVEGLIFIFLLFSYIFLFLSTPHFYPFGHWSWRRECPAGSTLCNLPTPCRLQSPPFPVPRRATTCHDIPVQRPDQIRNVFRQQMRNNQNGSCTTKPQETFNRQLTCHRLHTVDPSSSIKRHRQFVIISESRGH